MDQEEFEKLSPEEQEKVFHQTPFREREDLLLQSNNPLRLVQSISREELYLLTREMDLDERSEVREGLEEELAWLSNKVIACDGISFASEERVRLGIERSRRLVSIGLERLSGGDLYQARKILKEKWLEHLFR